MGDRRAADRSRTPLNSDRGDAQPLDIEFEQAYQLIIDVGSRTTFAHDVLLRGPQGEDAITVLSQVTDLNRRRFDHACRSLAVKGAAQLAIEQLVFIGCQPSAVEPPALCVHTILDAARLHRLPAERIVCAVPESHGVEDSGRALDILREGRRCGFKTAIDNFGGGFAGLKLLADFQPDLIKLDLAFAHHLGDSRSRQAIVRGLVRLCDDLAIQVIAQGIETAAERDLLFDAGIRLMQGDWFARPALRKVAVVEPSAWRPGLPGRATD